MLYYSLCTLENKVSLYANDLNYLNPKQWLNDTIIDFSVLMFQRIYNTESTTFISSSFFFTRLFEEYK
jgi:Ulp1 family protease